MSEIVFILGAGASREAGAPLMADFLDKADELRRGGNLPNGFQHDFDGVFDAISKLQSVYAKSTMDLDNIESVFAAFEMGRLLQRLPGRSSDQIDALLISMRRLIFKTLEDTINFPVKDGRLLPCPTYEAFAGLIRELDTQSRHRRCSVITFNYDLALDHALHAQGVPADYCLTEHIQAGKTAVMKLHGSLNWTKCSVCGRIVPWEMEHYLVEHHLPPGTEGEIAHIGLASQLPESGLNCCNEDVDPDPVIVPPTWNKTEYQQTLSKVWSHAASELSDAENIFVCGYSLPENDLFFKYLFALGSVGNARIKRFLVYDPDQHVQDRFLRLIGPDAKKGFRSRRLEFGSVAGQILRELQGK